MCFKVKEGDLIVSISTLSHNQHSLCTQFQYMATSINPSLRSHQAMVQECEHKQEPKIISWRSPPNTSKIHLKKNVYKVWKGKTNYKKVQGYSKVIIILFLKAVLKIPVTIISQGRGAVLFACQLWYFLVTVLRTKAPACCMPCHPMYCHLIMQDDENCVLD